MFLPKNRVALFGNMLSRVRIINDALRTVRSERRRSQTSPRVDAEGEAQTGYSWKGAAKGRYGDRADDGSTGRMRQNPTLFSAPILGMPTRRTFRASPPISPLHRTTKGPIEWRNNGGATRYALRFFKNSSVSQLKSENHAMRIAILQGSKGVSCPSLVCGRLTLWSTR